mmetsp:Transcript_7007/g.17898  ORF Transcript_7007/g.17898 Transcript_7007/m.17898 type:complete len:585 (-) Transcript_7007:109-1863(-)
MLASKKSFHVARFGRGASTSGREGARSRIRPKSAGGDSPRALSLCYSFDFLSGLPLSADKAKRMEHEAALGKTCESIYSLESWEMVSLEAVKSSEAREIAEQEQEQDNVPVFVMLPLDTVYRGEKDGVQIPVLKTPKALNESLQRLKNTGVTGVMVDVWWGMVEASEPGKYNFDPYLELLEMAALTGLKVQAVMSFHAAGGNVGDNVNIPLPDWVLSACEEYPDILYTDASGFRNPECLSLGCDNEAVLMGRTPVQAYRDFSEAFLSATTGYLGWVVSEITVGLGPAGEMRYPSYPEGDGRWRFPGIGEFQCYDSYMLADLKVKAKQVNHPEWGHGGPHDSGQYNNCPWDTGFFHPENGSFNTEYGKFFLNWYSSLLVEHGDRVLTSIEEVMREKCPAPSAIRCRHKDGVVSLKVLEEVKMGVKLAGVHWWYRSSSHAGELTAGYHNTREHNGYEAIMAMLKRHKASANFTAVEMRDCEQPEYAKCSPEGLLGQMQEEALKCSVPLSGENALQRYDKFAFDQIEHVSYGKGEETDSTSHHPQLKQLTFLRMGQSMFDNWDAFESFMARMNRKLPKSTKISWLRG